MKTLLALSLLINFFAVDPRRTVPGETIPEREAREKAGAETPIIRTPTTKQSAKDDADAIIALAEKKLEKESAMNQRWVRAVARGEKPYEMIKAKDAYRLLATPEIKSWIKCEASRIRSERIAEAKREQERKKISRTKN